MPTTIYHPSLALGQVVKPEVFDLVKQIATAEDKIEAARERLNSAIALKRSLSMTVTELASINVDTTDLLDALTNTDQKIKQAAKSYVSTRIAEEGKALQAKNKLSNLRDVASLESPVDMNQSKIERFPLGTDSLRLDAQYFSFAGQSTQNPITVVGGVENFVRETAAELGTKAANELGEKAGRQLKDQLQNHQLAGTLVITASCTHRHAAMLSPLVLNASQTVSAWNQLYPKDVINVHDQDALSSLLIGTSAGRSSNSRGRKTRSGSSNDQSTIRIISGMGQGSGFVGMVHLLKTDSLSLGNKGLFELAEKLQERFTISTWLENESGGIGADQSMTEEIRQLLSANSINAHITLTTIGVIPSVTSNQLQSGLKGITESSDFSSFLKDADSIEDNDLSSVKQGSDSAKVAKRAVSMHGATVGQLLSGLGEIDKRSDKVLNINSLMTAFEDYLKEVKTGGAGMPVHFYYRSLSKSDIAELAMRKYFGQQEQATSSPDSESNRPAKVK